MASATVPSVIADCAGSNLPLTITRGSNDARCCSKMDGAQDKSYYAKFHSVNNDRYGVQIFVDDDSDQIGYCTMKGEWQSTISKYGPDNFEHTEYFYIASK